jgi:hypothetical protein
MRALIVSSYNKDNANVKIPGFSIASIKSVNEFSGDIVVYHDIETSIIGIISILQLYDYDIKSVVIQVENRNWNNVFNNINNDLKSFNVQMVVINNDNWTNKKFVDSILSKLLNINCMKDKIVRSSAIDKNDIKNSKHGRIHHVGSIIGNYVQSPPMLFNKDGHSMWFGDMYSGRSAFLILGGPSFSLVNKSLLNHPGILTMGVNNSVKTFRPNLWVSVDSPTHFMKSIWFDPQITKFVPYSHVNKTLFDNERWIELQITVGECPNVWYYKRNEKFDASKFLFEDTFNWGNHKQYGGGRSVMLVAIRMLFYLGVRTVYLLGCDLNMTETSKYHFEQDRLESSIKGNSKTYKLLIERFEQLKPIFDKYDYKIYNCNQNSNLKIFPFIEFEQAIKYAKFDMPKDIQNERTAGLYDRLAKNKKKDPK